jgi:two-component system phosphate regulon sensor histidine kinase PhoR
MAQTPCVETGSSVTKPTGPMLVSRQLLLVFGGVMLLVFGQLGWWMVYHVRSVNEMRAVRLRSLYDQRQDALRLLNYAVQAAEAGGTAAPAAARPQDLALLPSTLLTKHFPELYWSAQPSDNATLQQRFAGHDVAIRPEVLITLNQRHDALIRMFLSEGAFFLLMVSLGAVLIVRTLRHETALLRQQGNFLSAVSHELKSPLASIRLHTQTLQLRDPPAPTRSRYLRFMRDDLDRLESLVGNLLAVARLDSGKFIVHAQRLDMVQEVRRVVQELDQAWQAQTAQDSAAEPVYAGVVAAAAVPAAAAAARPRRIHFEAESAPLWVQCDAAALATVVRNLLDNAGKYGGGHSVEVRVAAADGRATLTVIDQGLGLAAADRVKIFQKFYRVGDELVRQTEGSGLGLYLVHALLQQSGGAVEAHSDGPGRGTTFVASLPLHPEPVKFT